VLPDHPDGDDPAVATRITEAGIRAWHQYLPARVHYEPAQPHIHDAFRLYRSLRFGDLLQLVVTDHRLYRDGPPPRALSAFGVTLGVRGDDDSDRSMLGAEQLAWFERRTRAADTRWLGWASAVLSIPFRIGVGPLAVYPKAGSTWDGFGAERRRVFELLGDSDQAVVTLSGDLHSYVVGAQRLDGTSGEAVGTEFMTPAVTSVNIAEALGIDSGVLGRLTRPLVRRAVPAMNPQMEFFDPHEWGYSVVEFTRESCTYTAYAVDKTVDSAEADRTVVSRYRRRHDRPVPTPLRAAARR
jgi:alkaline phosphatase D